MRLAPIGCHSKDNAQGSDGKLKEKPEKPTRRDSIFNKGTMLGMGQFLFAQEGSAYFAIHEGPTALPLNLNVHVSSTSFQPSMGCEDKIALILLVAAATWHAVDFERAGLS